MSSRYPGPLRAEPISVELYNTLYAIPAGPVDGLADSASRLAFLHDIAPRLGPSSQLGANPPDAADLLELRRVVRLALQAAIDPHPHAPEVIETLNQFAARAPSSIRADVATGDGPPLATVNHHGASPSDITLAAFATDAIEFITSPKHADLRACGAPGCVLIYLKDNPRRRWCSNACGNRARQARHYQRRGAAS